MRNSMPLAILVMRSVLVLAIGASPAYAAPKTSAPVMCDIALTSPNAIACAGFYSKNMLSGSSTNITRQQSAIASLPGDFTFDGNWNALDSLYKIDSLANGNQLNFGTRMFGETIFGAHFGNAAGPAGNVSVFWLLDLGSAGADYISLDDAKGFSNAVLYTTNNVPAVPEPSTWLLMVLGFGAVGYGMRASRREKSRVTYC